MGSTTMMLNPRACILWKALWLPNLPKNTCVLPTALTSRIHSNCWREFCVVSCFIILKRGHYLCIVFISYFCQPQNVKQSVIAGIMGQRSPTSTGSLAVSAPGNDFTITSQQTEQEQEGKCVSVVDGTKSKRRWKRLLSFPVHSLFLVGQIQSAVPAGGLQQQLTGHEGNSTHHDALFARRWGSVLQLFMWGLQVLLDECF